MRSALAAFSAAVVTVAVFAAVSPAAGVKRPAAAPRTNAAAARLVRTDVGKLAAAYEHKRYATVCADLTAGALKLLGGTSKCAIKAAVLHAILPIKRLKVVKVTLGKRRTQALVAAAVNGSRKHVLRADFTWAAGSYRLARNVSAIPTG